MKDFCRIFSRGAIEDQDDVVPVAGKFFDLPAVSTNNLVVTAVSGKTIRVLSMTLKSDAGVTEILFRSASGGTVIFGAHIPTNTAATPNVIWPWDIFGLMETSTGQGLYADAGNARIFGTIRYVTITP